MPNYSLNVTTGETLVMVTWPEHFPWEDFFFLDCLIVSSYVTGTPDGLTSPVNTHTMFKVIEQRTCRVARALFGDRIYKEIILLSRAKGMADRVDIPVTKKEYERITKTLSSDWYAIHERSYE